MSKHYHFIGIGGVGMGALATIMLNKGFTVSGSDIKENQMIDHLRQQGASVFIGHKKSNIKGSDFIIFSSAIKEDNPEIQAAQSKKIPIFRRAELLAQLMNTQKGITIAGAHGKTTTTSMVSNLLTAAGMHPTTAIGGIINNASFATLGKGKYFVAEVDESDGSFLFFSPTYSIITNIDFEHIDYYKNWNNILMAYQQFILRTVKKGWLIIYGDDQRLKKLVNSRKNVLTFGLSEANHAYAKNISREGTMTKFDCVIDRKNQGQITLHVPGKHNILNALACISLGVILKIDFNTIRESLKDYQGVQRRFQVRGHVNDILIIDDYGHHPTEIKTTIETAKSICAQKVITVFQPHRYSRTLHLMEEFVGCLKGSDELILTDIYAAGEAPIDGVSSVQLLEKINEKRQSPVIYCKKEEINDRLLNLVQPGDMILVLGAGDINKIVDELIVQLEKKEFLPKGVINQKTSFS